MHRPRRWQQLGEQHLALDERPGTHVLTIPPENIESPEPGRSFNSPLLYLPFAPSNGSIAHEIKRGVAALIGDDQLGIKYDIGQSSQRLQHLRETITEGSPGRDVMSA